MSMYGDYEKDSLYYELIRFLEDREEGISDLFDIFSDAFVHNYYRIIDKKVKDIEAECLMYKEKYEKMKEIFMVN